MCDSVWIKRFLDDLVVFWLVGCFGFVCGRCDVLGGWDWIID